MNVVSFSGDYWDGPRHNRHYFCEALSRRGQVLFVSPPVDVTKLQRELGRGHRTGVRTISPSLVNYAPSKLLFTNHRFPRVNEWMKRQRLKTIGRLMERQGMRAPVLLIWHPYFRDMIGRLGESLVVYYAYDQYSGYTGGTVAPNPQEVELMERADVVFVLSRELLADKKKQVSNPAKVVHLPNAADFAMFSRSRDAATTVPGDLAAIPHPRIGYIGTINEKVSLPILEELSSARPGWSIVLIGRENYKVAAEKQRFLDLVARPNVHWLGPRSFELVPAYIKGLDVCTMCYIINNWTFYGDPSKLHEYLASGKPTIGTGLPSIREFADVVDIPETPQEWVAAVDRALAEQGPALSERRIETARQNSYDARIDRFIDVVTRALEEKRAGAGTRAGRA